MDKPQPKHPIRKFRVTYHDKAKRIINYEDKYGCEDELDDFGIIEEWQFFRRHTRLNVDEAYDFDEVLEWMTNEPYEKPIEEVSQDEV